MINTTSWRRSATNGMPSWKDAATAYLGSDQVGAGQNAIVRLFIGGPDPERSYVERWLGRKEAEAARLATERHQESLAISRKSVRWAFWAFVAGPLLLSSGYCHSSNNARNVRNG
jgi:hypothetical protein